MERLLLLLQHDDDEEAAAAAITYYRKIHYLHAAAFVTSKSKGGQGCKALSEDFLTVSNALFLKDAWRGVTTTWTCEKRTLFSAFPEIEK